MESIEGDGLHRHRCSGLGSNPSGVQILGLLYFEADPKQNAAMIAISGAGRVQWMAVANYKLRRALTFLPRIFALIQTGHPTVAI